MVTSSSKARLASPPAMWALSISFVLLLVGLTAFQIRDSHQRTLQLAGTNLADTARITEEELRRNLGIVRMSLAAVLAEASNGDRAEFRDFIDTRIHAIPNVQKALLADASGQVAVSTDRALEGISVAEEEFFIGAKALSGGRDVFLTKPLHRADGALVVFAAMPMRDKGGAFQGVAALALDPAYFLRVLQSVHTGEPGAGALLVSPDGDVIGRDPEPGKYLGINIANGGAFSAHRRSGQTASVLTHVTATDGQEKLSAVRTLIDDNLPPLVVIVGRPLAGVLAPWRSESAVHSLVVAALALAVFGLTALTGRHVVALRASEQKTRGMVELAPLGLALTDMDGRFLEANDAFQAIVGLDMETLADMTERQLTPARHAAEDEAQAQDLLRTGRCGPYEKHYRHRDGRDIPVRLRGMRIAGACRWLIVEDITEERAAAVELAARTAELTRSNADLEQFAYVVSHDLREPLRTVNSFLTLLDKRYGKELDDEAREFIRFACDGAVRMNGMVRDLLEYSRVGRSVHPTIAVRLDESARHACEFLAIAIDDTGAQIRLPATPLAVTGVEDEIIRLLQNLIGNALKYHRADVAPEVAVDWREEDGMVRLSVADNGIGIAPEFRERIFLLFQRLHSRDEYGGTGIGLALCKKIVESHGGRIWAEGNEAGGTTFIATLPLCREAVEALV